jgi:hypothetical protein
MTSAFSGNVFSVSNVTVNVINSPGATVIIASQVNNSVVVPVAQPWYTLPLGGPSYVALF